MSLSLEQVRHVASLARLALSPDEERQCQRQLSAILDAMEQLKAVNTADIEPTSHASVDALGTGANAGREDVLLPSLSPELALANAPAKSGSSFAVPKILD